MQAGALQDPVAERHPCLKALKERTRNEMAISPLYISVWLAPHLSADRAILLDACPCAAGPIALLGVIAGRGLIFELSLTAFPVSTYCTTMFYACDYQKARFVIRTGRSIYDACQSEVEVFRIDGRDFRFA